MLRPAKSMPYVTFRGAAKKFKFAFRQAGKDGNFGERLFVGG
jgi:hypothetical protein